jgi:hypothetical protein
MDTRKKIEEIFVGLDEAEKDLDLYERRFGVDIQSTGSRERLADLRARAESAMTLQDALDKSDAFMDGFKERVMVFRIE